MNRREARKLALFVINRILEVEMNETMLRNEAPGKPADQEKIIEAAYDELWHMREKYDRLSAKRERNGK